MNMECIEWKAAELVVVVSTGAVIVVVRVRVRSAFNEGVILLRGVKTHKGGSSPIIRISYIAAFHGLAIGPDCHFVFSVFSPVHRYLVTLESIMTMRRVCLANKFVSRGETHLETATAVGP